MGSRNIETRFHDSLWYLRPSEVYSAAKQQKQARLHDSLCGLDKSKLDFMIRFVASKIETRLHDSMWAFRSRLSRNNKQTQQQHTRQNKTTLDFMIRFGASNNENSTSWLALGPRKVKTRLHDSLWYLRPPEVDSAARSPHQTQKHNNKQT